MGPSPVSERYFLRGLIEINVGEALIGEAAVLPNAEERVAAPKAARSFLLPLRSVSYPR